MNENRDFTHGHVELCIDQHITKEEYLFSREMFFKSFKRKNPNNETEEQKMFQKVLSTLIKKTTEEYTLISIMKDNYDFNERQIKVINKMLTTIRNNINELSGFSKILSKYRIISDDEFCEKEGDMRIPKNLEFDYEAGKYFKK